MTENTMVERVAILEVKLDDLETTQEKILKELEELNASLIKYKGFIGGVTFVATSIFTFLTFAKEWVLTHLK